METFEKEYEKFVVTFKNENDYIEEGFLEGNPKFEGILIREKFSSKLVEFFPNDIKFFLNEFKKLPPLEKYVTETKKPLIKFIQQYGSSQGFSSDYCIVIQTYDGCYCKFYMNISHQMVLNMDIFRENSPEFPLDTIIKIFEDAMELKRKEK